MTDADKKFMGQVGIEPFTLCDPFPASLPRPLPPRRVIPTLMEKDARWLHNLGIVWEQDPEPGSSYPRPSGNT